MISANLFVLIALIVLAIIFVIVLVFTKKGKQRKIDYHNFFIMGIIWTGAGIALGIGSGSYFLFIMGLVFMTLGLIHKKEWKQNIADRKKRWQSMSKRDKKKLMIIKWVLVGFVLLGLAVFLIMNFMNK
ncbi:MAG: hypothetical protein P8X70_00440 [Nanoarchaeota archaeon]